MKNLGFITCFGGRQRNECTVRDPVRQP